LLIEQTGTPFKKNHNPLITNDSIAGPFSESLILLRLFVMKLFKSLEQIELKSKPTNWNFKDLEGRRFGQLYVAGYLGKRFLNANTFWLVHCDCGSFGRVSTQQLTGGKVTSCGCLDRLKKQKSQNSEAVKPETNNYETQN
jgi:hypothetical protein